MGIEEQKEVAINSMQRENENMRRGVHLWKLG